MKKSTKTIMLIVDAVLILALIAGVWLYQRRSAEKELQAIGEEDPSRRYNIYGHDGILMEDKTRGTEEQLYNSELHCRYWCNQMFYYDAFTDEERARILLTHNENPNNPDSGVKGGPDTDDYVFFLSAPEVYEYLPTNDSRRRSWR